MTERTATDMMATALRSAGLNVREIVRRTHPQESDLVRLDDDYYVALDYEYFERGGIVQVALDQSMPVGGDVLIDDWMIPDVPLEVVAAEIAQYRKP